MNRKPRTALTVAAALLMLGAAACTDTTELPITTITDTNYFNDPSSYRAFLARIYAGGRARARPCHEARGARCVTRLVTRDLSRRSRRAS